MILLERCVLEEIVIEGDESMIKMIPAMEKDWRRQHPSA